MDFKLDYHGESSLEGKIYGKPGKNIRRVVVFIHGLGEHFGRYDWWAKSFSNAGTAFIGIDLPGHGRSPGKRGHISSYHEYNRIIDNLASYAAGIFGDVPAGIYGHSLGGNIVLNYLLTNSAGFHFSVVSSPWLGLVNNPSRFSTTMAGLVSCICPGLQQANGLKVDHISVSEETRNKYLHDPLVHDRVSVRLFTEASKASRRIIDDGNMITVPLLLLHGTGDMITSCDITRQFAKERNNIKFVDWPGGYHELHNEPFKEEVFALVAEWLNKLEH